MSQLVNHSIIDKESDVTKFIKESDEKNNKIANLGKISPLPSDFPLIYTFESEEVILMRMNEHLTRLNEVFSQIGEFTLLDQGKILSNVASAHSEFFNRITPLLESFFSTLIHEPKLSGIDEGASKLIIDAQVDILASTTDIGKITKKLVERYSEYYNLYVARNAKLSHMVDNLQGITSDSVTDLIK